MPIAASGTVAQIIIQNTGMLGIIVLLDQGSAGSEWFTLFATPEGQFEFAPLWVMRSMTLAMLQHAFTNQKTITIWHESTSAIIESIEFWK